MTISEIEKKANELLLHTDCFEAPIPIKSIIKSLNIKISPYDLGEDVSGVLVIEDENYNIGYNSTESLVRQRFTLAHELGHFILHKDKQPIFVDNVKYMFRKQQTNNKASKLEMEANQFAASILMPKSLIKKEIENLDNHILSDHHLISELSKKFKVSQIAMTYRLNNLGYFYSF